MSKYLENVRLALTALLSNKFRALLTTLGIGIGIAAVVILVSVGQSFQAYVAKQFLSVGSDLVYVRPAQSANAGQTPFGRTGLALSSLTEKDVAALQDPFNIQNVKSVVPLVQLTRTTSFGANSVRESIYGTTSLYFDTLNRPIASGRQFDEQDVLSSARVAVLGQTALKNLFPDGASPIGETIRVGDVPFRVIGTLQKSGGSGFGVDQDNLIVVPITAAQSHLETERSLTGALPISQIYVQAADLDRIDGVVQAATQLVRRQHKIKPGDDDDFQVSAQKDLLNSFDSVIAILTTFLAILGGTSLLVGGIGVMNIMLVTVSERTREIGLRKAVGARGRDVLLQFLTEAVVLCSVGALAGLALAGLVMMILRVAVAALEPAVSVQSMVLAVSVTTFIGVFFGLYPASRAAALSPIQALRSE